MTVGTACVLDGSVCDGIAVVPAGNVKNVSVEHPDRRVQRRARGRSGQPAERHPRGAAAHRAAHHARRGDGSRLGLERKTDVIIDCHGHYTTAPKALEDWRNRQIAGLKDPAGRAEGLGARDQRRRAARDASRPTSSRKMKERGSDLTIFSPRASFMAHHIGDFDDQRDLGGDLQRALLPRQPALPRQLHRRGDAAAVARASTRATCIPELEKCVKEYGFVAHQPQPRSVGRPLEGAAAVRPALVPASTRRWSSTTSRR